MILEEAAYVTAIDTTQLPTVLWVYVLTHCSAVVSQIDPRLFSKVIVPLLLMKYVCVYAISSPSDETKSAHHTNITR